MSLRKNQVTEIAEWIVEQVDSDDFDELVRQLPDELRKEYIRKNTLEQQPSSTWKHYRNWTIYVRKPDVGLSIIAFIIWAAIIELSIAVWPSSGVSRGEVINMVVLSTLILQIIPRIITFVRWRRWFATHPISLHRYWRPKDYLN